MSSDVKPGWHFLQIPGPTNVPDRVLRAIGRPTIDHRGPEFAALLGGIRERLGQVFQTRHPVALYPSSGTGMWEAALVNTHLGAMNELMLAGTLSGVEMGLALAGVPPRSRWTSSRSKSWARSSCEKRDSVV